MRFYYTTPVEEGYTQNRADLSLGGFRSANPAPNASPRNLFSDVSIYSIRTNRPEYIGLVLRNETGVAVTATLHFTYPENCQMVYAVAAVDLNADGQMEHIDTPYQAPYFAEFYEANGEANAVDLGEMAANESMGIWLRRSLNIEAITGQYSDESLATNGNPIEADEDVQIVITYNPV